MYQNIIRKSDFGLTQDWFGPTAIDCNSRYILQTCILHGLYSPLFTSINHTWLFQIIHDYTLIWTQLLYRITQRFILRTTANYDIFIVHTNCTNSSVFIRLEEVLLLERSIKIKSNRKQFQTFFAKNDLLLLTFTYNNFSCISPKNRLEYFWSFGAIPAAMDKNRSDQEEHEVEAIIGHRLKNGKVCIKNSSIKKIHISCVFTINLHGFN